MSGRNSITAERHKSHTKEKISQKLTNMRKVHEGRWTKEEHRVFVEEILKFGIRNWKKHEDKIKTRTNCQIRSHFQKFLKKICGKYNLSRSLNEIYIENTSHMNPEDLKVVQIFNSYKKMKNKTRKRKMEINYKKRMAKKQFFKIKKPLEQIENDAPSTIHSKQEEELKPKSTLQFGKSQEKGLNLASLNQINTLFIYNYLVHIKIMNHIVLENIHSSNFDFATTVQMLNGLSQLYNK